MKVLHKLASLDPAHGGPSRSVPALVDALDRVGVQVVFSIHDGRRVTERTGRFDAIHDHGLWLRCNHAAAVASRRTGAPLVISPRGMLEPWALNHRRWKKRAAWHLYQRDDLWTAAVIHVTGEGEAESVRRVGLRNPVAVIPNGVDAPGNLPPRSRHGLSRVLFLSRIHPKKGLPMLIDAWARVRPHDWELVIAGPDEDRHYRIVEAQARSLGLNGSIQFLGPVEDDSKWELYRSADLFVLPTNSENFGLVVAEALAASVPVLTTKGAPWAALETHRCGWWVDIGVEPLASALGQAMALSDDQRWEMGARGRRYVQGHLSWDRIAREMRSVYEWVLGQGPKPACVHLA